MKGMGFSDYSIAQTLYYAQDYQRNAFAVNAPTDVVRALTGCEPESYETIVRRYAASMPDAKRSLGTALKFMAWMPLWMPLPGPDTNWPLTPGRLLPKGTYQPQRRLLRMAAKP